MTRCNLCETAMIAITVASVGIGVAVLAEEFYQAYKRGKHERSR